MAARSYWRIVRTNPPTQRDFLSHVALGIPLRHDDAETRRMAEGISVYATETQARRKARGVPILGGWLAELVIDDSAGLLIERTPGGSGHHTIWAGADMLHTSAKRVVPV